MQSCWWRFCCLSVAMMLFGLSGCREPLPPVPLPTDERPGKDDLVPHEPPAPEPLPPVVSLPAGERTVSDILAFYGPQAEDRLRPYFQAAALPYPPTALTLLGFKTEKRLEVWGQAQEKWVFVRSYEIQAASGVAGPKLREGDYQVPEGFYRIEALNPNSQFHLSMKIDYPNIFDRQQAIREGRKRLGGDIFLHGQAVSTGCLAMGNQAIEELFVLVVRVGIDNVNVLIAPYDLRQHGPQWRNVLRPWVAALYAELRQELEKYSLSRP